MHIWTYGFTAIVILGWIMAFVFLVRWLNNRRRIHSRTQLENLWLLRMELTRLWEKNRIDKEVYDRFIRRIDEMISHHILNTFARISDSGRNKRLESAWGILIARIGQPNLTPPWKDNKAYKKVYVPVEARSEEPVQDAIDMSEEISFADDDVVDMNFIEAVSDPDEAASISPQTPEAVESVPEEDQAHEEPVRDVQDIDENLEDTAAAAIRTEPEERQESHRHDWKPAPRSSLENAMASFSGWSKVMIPFLAQNIGWFVSAFLFIAGSIFLIIHTSGFLRSTIIAGILFSYTLLVIWGAYQIKRRRPELDTAVGVLLTLGMLLIPLSIAAAVRLIVLGSTALPLIGVGVTVTVINYAVFYWAAELSSGMIDRSLQRVHPKLYISITAMQLFAPIVVRYPFWPVLAAAHALIFGLMGYGLLRFSQDWLKSIYIDRRKIVYYAAGSLIYTAFISFAHLSWPYGKILPNGYYGPFLMVLSGILFILDAQFKQWTKQYTYLSRFSFALYGLSIAGVAMSWTIPWARTAALSFGLGVYGIVVWNYLTLPPLYLLLGCFSILYYFLILVHFTQETTFLAGVPGILAFLGMYRWTMKKNARSLAVFLFRILTVSVAVSTTWSLYGARPGIIPMCTSLMVTALIYAIFRYAPREVFHNLGLGGYLEQHEDRNIDLRNTYGYYLFTISGTAAVSYAPIVYHGFRWSTQLAFGFLILSFVWFEFGFRLYKKIHESTIVRISVLMNSAFLTSAAAVGVAALQTDTLQSVILMIAGFIWLRLSITLRIQRLLFLSLILIGAGLAIFKNIFFPGITPGTIELFAAFCFWTVLWIFERLPDDILDIQKEFEGLIKEPRIALMGVFPVTRNSLGEVVRLPLEVFMAILWVIAASKTGIYGYLKGPSTIFLVHAGIETAIAWLFIAHFRVLFLSAIPILAGLAVILTAVYSHSDLGTVLLVASVYALAMWWGAIMIIRLPFMVKLAGFLHLSGRHPGKGAKTEFELRTYQTTYAILFISICISIYQWINTLNTALISIFIVGMFYSISAGYLKKKRHHIYDFAAIMTFAVLVFHTRTLRISDQMDLVADPRTGFLLIFLSIMMAIFAWFSDQLENPARAFFQSLYRKPFRVSAAVLSFVGVTQNLVLVGIDAQVEINSMIASGIAGLILLWVNFKLEKQPLNLIGILFISVSIYWMESWVFHRSSTLHLMPVYDDQWLTIAALSLVWALAAQFVRRLPGGLKSTARSFWSVSVILYTISLFKTYPAVIHVLTNDPGASYWTGLFLVQGIALIPILQPFEDAPFWRGVGELIFVVGILLNLLNASMPGNPLIWTIIAFILWGISDGILPLFNRRLPQLEISPRLWPWAGLMMAALSRPILVNVKTIIHWTYWLPVAVYLFLMMHRSSSKILPGLAVFALTFTGISIGLDITHPMDSPTPAAFVLFVLAWCNFQLGLATAWRRYKTRIGIPGNWKKHNIAKPLEAFSAAIVVMIVIVVGLAEADKLLRYNISAFSRVSLIPVSMMAVISMVHIFTVRRYLFYAHGLLLAIFEIVLAFYIAAFPSISRLPLILTIYTGILFFVFLVSETKKWEFAEKLKKAVSQWIFIFTWAALVSLFSIPIESLSYFLINLSLLIVVMGTVGFFRQNQFLLVTARLLGFLLLHVWPLFWMSFPHTSRFTIFVDLVPMIQSEIFRIQALLPWYALQMSVLAWGILGAHLILSARMAQKYPQIHKLLWNYRVAATLGLLEWLFHFFLVFQNIPAFPISAYFQSQNIAAVVSVLLIMGIGVRIWWISGKHGWGYGVFGIVIAGYIYVRLLITGKTDILYGDTIFFMGLAYLFGFLYHLTNKKHITDPLMKLAFILPIAALFTVPLELGSTHAGSALFAAGLLYLSFQYSTGKPIFLFFGVLMINIAVYLWIPGWASDYNLIQLYVIPAASSVLLMLQLHRKELRRSVLNGARLTAVCALYAAAGIDVFLRPELWVFVLALGLGLAGIICGILFRIRAFLYGGSVFLVFNVIGQFVRFYPEQALSKGIVLIVLGAVIMVLMIWFSIQREEILKRIRIFRSDLEAWE